MDYGNTINNTVKRKLIKALKYENIVAFQRLLKDGSLNARAWIGDLGVTPLHLAIGYGTEAFASCATHDLLLYGADPNARSIDGMTPVHVAAAWGRVTVMHVLLLHSGDPWLQDEDGKNAFNHAFESKAFHVVEMLHNFQLLRVSDRPKLNQLPSSAVHISDYVPSKDERNSSSSNIDDYYENNKKEASNLFQFSLSDLRINDYVPSKDERYSVSTNNDYAYEDKKEESNCLQDKTFRCSPEKENLNVTFCIEPSEPADAMINGNDLFHSYSVSPNRFVTTSQIFPSNTKDIVLDPNLETSSHAISELNKFMTEISSQITKTSIEKYASKVDRGSIDIGTVKKDTALPFKEKSKQDCLNRKSEFQFLKPNIPKPPSIPIDKPSLGEKNHSSCKDNNCTYTISRQQSPVKMGKIGNVRENLFSELYAAVKRRSLRISGIAALQSSSDMTDAHLKIADEPTYKSNTTFILKNKNSEKKLDNDNDCSSSENIESKLTNETKFIPSTKKEIIKMEVIDLHIDESNFLGKKENCDFQDPRRVSDDFLSGSNASESSRKSILIIESTPKEIQVIDVSALTESFSSLPCCADDSASSGSYYSCGEMTTGENEDNVNEDDQLRLELRALGANPGPITNSTRSVYQRRLLRLKLRGPIIRPPRPARPRQLPPALEREPGVYIYPSSFCPELIAAIDNEAMVKDYEPLEVALREQFETPGISWRDGRSRTNFNYLLLDGRLTNNLPQREITSVIPSVLTQQFLRAIFYVGKGRAGRPFSHLQDAVTAWRRNLEPRTPKESVILDIWRAGAGVGCLQVFHNAIPAEAFTCEAAMIDALGRQNLRNLRRGEYYGAMANWSDENKRKLGVYLLFKVKNILLRDGIRPMRPEDL